MGTISAPANRVPLVRKVWHFTQFTLNTFFHVVRISLKQLKKVAKNNKFSFQSIIKLTTLVIKKLTIKHLPEEDLYSFSFLTDTDFPWNQTYAKMHYISPVDIPI